VREEGSSQQLLVNSGMEPKGVGERWGEDRGTAIKKKKRLRHNIVASETGLSHKRKDEKWRVKGGTKTKRGEKGRGKGNTQEKNRL